MPTKIVFECLSPIKLKKKTEAIEIAYQLISVTLTEGDILLGCLGKHWRWDGQVVSVGFNTLDGKRFGHSRYVQIPINLIADIQSIPLSDGCIPRVDEDDTDLAFLRELGFTDEKYARLMVQDYPNPLASIIYEHNIDIIGKYELPVLDFIEKSLSEDAIPPEGIKFEDDLILYVDWDFFSRQMGGETSLSSGIPGVMGISRNLKSSLQNEVIKRVKNTLIDRSLRQGTSSSQIKEYQIQGCIFVPEAPEDTVIEGEKCISVFCANNEEGDDEIYPLLLKPKSLTYPLEFLNRVTSPLNFYGQLLPIPLKVLGKSYKSTLLVRAIGYFAD